MANCKYCGKELSADRRKDAETCNATCRGRAWRRWVRAICAKAIPADDAKLAELVERHEGISLRKLGMMSDADVLALRDANKPKDSQKQ